MEPQRIPRKNKHIVILPILAMLQHRQAAAKEKKPKNKTTTITQQSVVESYKMVDSIYTQSVNFSFNMTIRASTKMKIQNIHPSIHLFIQKLHLDVLNDVQSMLQHRKIHCCHTPQLIKCHKKYFDFLNLKKFQHHNKFIF